MLSNYEIWACEENYLVGYLNLTSNIDLDVQTKALNLGSLVEDSDILSFSGDGVANIEIEGSLSKNGPPLIAKLFGYRGTSYRDIISNVKAVGSMADVKTVRLRMNTPGGAVSGVDETYTAIKELAKTKNVIAENHGMIASAGYWLASAADRIESTSPVNSTGSIGVIITQRLDDEYEKAHYKTVKSSGAPNKNPDASTDDGLAEIQKHADAIERVFIDRVADGRNTTSDNVRKNFGRGGLLIASDPASDKHDALTVGMIDAVTSVEINKGQTMSEQAIETIKLSTPQMLADAGVQAEIKRIKDEAYLAGVAASDQAAKDLQQRDKEAAKFLKGDYPDSIKSVAYSVLEGDVSLDMLKGAAIVFEAMSAKESIETAASESEETGSTYSKKDTKNQEDLGVITDDDEAAAIAELEGV